MVKRAARNGIDASRRTRRGGLAVRLRGELTCRVIGLGGVGQPVAIHLARFLAGLNRPARVVLIDGDHFEAGNETRMAVMGLLENKATALQAQLAQIVRGTEVTVVAVPEHVTPDNVARLLRGGPGESVLMCVDNHATRRLVSDHVRRLDDVCLVSGGNDGIGPDGSGATRHGTAGNVQVFIRRGGRNLTPALTDHHPEIASPRDHWPDEAGCGELIRSMPQLLFTNLYTASCVLSAWWLYACDALEYCELVFDIRAGRAAPLLPINPRRPSRRTSGR